MDLKKVYQRYATWEKSCGQGLGARQGEVTREYLSAICCVSTMAELRNVLQLCLDLLEEDACPRMKKLAVGASSQAATTASEFFTCLGKEQIPFALPSHTSMFGWPSWHNMRMLASLALPDVP